MTEIVGIPSNHWPLSGSLEGKGLNAKEYYLEYNIIDFLPWSYLLQNGARISLKLITLNTSQINKELNLHWMNYLYLPTWNLQIFIKLWI